MQFLMVENALAGSSEADALDAVAEVLAAAGGLDRAACRTPEDLGAAVRSAAVDGVRAVVCGGDGSVHSFVQAAYAAGLLDALGPVGVIPMGTGNDLARTLGLPLGDPAAAARAVVEGRPLDLDLLVDDEGSVVVNAVHAGIGADAARAAGSLKPGLGPLAYPVGALAAGLTATGWPVRVTVDDVVVHEGDVLMVGVGVGRTVGGGAPLTPDAQVSDGLAEVVVSTATGPLARVGFASALRSGEHVERDDVHTARGRRVLLETVPATGGGTDGVEDGGTDDTTGFGLNADGELSGPVTRREWRVEPRRWAVVVPRA